MALFLESLLSPLFGDEVWIVKFRHGDIDDIRLELVLTVPVEYPGLKVLIAFVHPDERIHLCVRETETVFVA